MKIEWCVEHDSKENEYGLCQWVLIEDRYLAYSITECDIRHADIYMEGQGGYNVG